MGKEQGDELPDPVYYQREINGETVTRPAYVPADHVNLRAHGWTQTEEAAEPATEPAPAEGERLAGSQPRERARVVRSSAPVGDEAAPGAV